MCLATHRKFKLSISDSFMGSFLRVKYGKVLGANLALVITFLKTLRRHQRAKLSLIVGRYGF